MVEYTCTRCHYFTNLKGNFRHHLNRKRPCKTLFSEETIFSIKEKYGLNMVIKKNGVILSSQMVSKGVTKGVTNVFFILPMESHFSILNIC